MEIEHTIIQYGPNNEPHINFKCPGCGMLQFEHIERASEPSRCSTCRDSFEIPGNESLRDYLGNLDIDTLPDESRWAHLKNQRASTTNEEQERAN